MRRHRARRVIAAGALRGIVLHFHEVEGHCAIWRVHEMKDKKRKPGAEQVRHEHGKRNAAESGAGQLRHDQPRAETALAAAEETLDLNAVDVVLPLAFRGFAPFLFVLRRPAGPRPDISTPRSSQVEHLFLLRIQPAYRVEVPDVPAVLQGKAPAQKCHLTRFFRLVHVRAPAKCEVFGPSITFICT